MTIIFFKVNGDSFILRKKTYDWTTESFDLNTEAVETGIQTTLKRLKRLEHYSFVEGLYKNPPPSDIKNRKKNYLSGYKDQMTTMFPEIKYDAYLLEDLTYKSETKVFTVLTERVGDWKKVIFKCPEESEPCTFYESLYFNPPLENITSQKQIFE